jgi:FdhD protein
VVPGLSGEPPASAGRLTTTTASCGVCGSRTIDDLCARLPRLAPAPVTLGAVRAAVDALPGAQSVFGSTGSVHGAATFALADGTLGAVREDVGRHNAVDKLLGRLLLDGGLPATGLGLALSGRVSVELVQKAWAGGFGAVAAVGGPSSLAVETAAAAGITLAGFVRDGRATVYAGELSG